MHSHIPIYITDKSTLLFIFTVQLTCKNWLKKGSEIKRHICEREKNTHIGGVIKCQQQFFP